MAEQSHLGCVISILRGQFPRLSRDIFDREFGETIDAALVNLAGRLPEFNREIRRHMADVKILCLSEVADSILMWSHYAEQHRGVVLRFKCIPETDSAWGVAKCVNYRAAMPRLIDDDLLVQMLAGQKPLDHREMTFRLIYTKAPDWGYEKEWRVCAGSGRSSAATEDFPFHARELDAVYFGCRMPQADRSAIARIVEQKYPHAELFQAQKSEQKFELVFVPAGPEVSSD